MLTEKLPIPANVPRQPVADYPAADLQALENDHVRVFACKTTFERALVLEGTLEMLAQAADDIGAPAMAKLVRKAIKELGKAGLGDEQRQSILKPVKEIVLNTAKRFGKARFAQIVARHIDELDLPTWPVDPSSVHVAVHEDQEGPRVVFVMNPTPGDLVARASFAGVEALVDVVTDARIARADGAFELSVPARVVRIMEVVRDE